ncbi:uncharacterized protein A1O5_13250 [Cladophialophora psammophila CBS 110553]|uniref:3-oxoacyl-[acyl-carrier protein] reductase n=1 Tax=Cladophialophora psammophila CBS 110553 TaxID=1182543 RepID=W9W4F9_9EURO|nr:uncharacterized protein A1O5_13250 [Cladophialophora psammophila CBS 110553]EXJ53474.1 hypothetical protein A1O5_13250 [Cladophialophora psammophila CBS 110553]
MIGLQREQNYRRDLEPHRAYNCYTQNESGSICLIIFCPPGYLKRLCLFIYTLACNRKSIPETSYSVGILSQISENNGVEVSGAVGETPSVSGGLPHSGYLETLSTAFVLAVDINAAGNEQTAASCPSGTCYALTADITLESSWREILSTTLAKFSNRLDVVVNCAGVVHHAAPAHEISEETFDRMYKVNVKPIFLSTKVVVAWWKENKLPGHYINFSSAREPRPRPKMVWYSGSKGAVAGTTKGLAAEYACDKIRFNYIRVSLGETGMLLAAVAGNDTPENRKTYLDTIPLGRLCQPTDIADMVCFLASDEACYITGAGFDVDGGRCVS